MEKKDDLFALFASLVSDGKNDSQVSASLKDRDVNWIRAELQVMSWMPRSQIALGLTGSPGDLSNKGKDWLYLPIQKDKQGALSVSADYHCPPAQPISTKLPIPLELAENVGIELRWTGPRVDLRIYTLSASSWPEVRLSILLKERPTSVSVGVNGAPTEAWCGLYFGKE